MLSRKWVWYTLALLFLTGAGSEHETPTPGSHPPATVTPPPREDAAVPNTKLVAELFHERPDAAKAHVKAVQTATDGEDEGYAAEVIVDLMYSLNLDQKRDALDRLRDEVKMPEVKADAGRFALVSRLLWAIEELMGVDRKKSALPDSTVAGKFKDKVKPALDKARADAAEFRKNLAAAGKGDEAAMKKLLDGYGAEALIDFMSSQKDADRSDVAAKLARVLGWQDGKGVTHLDVKTPDTGTPLRTLTLGDTDEEIKKALQAFDKPGAHELQGATLNRVPAEPGERRFFKAGSDGAPRPYSPHVLVPQDKSMCRIDDPSRVKSVDTTQRPNYFFRPFPFSNRGSYASSNGSPNRNIIVDYDTGGEVRMPGEYDPVPTPDELYMTVPSDDRKVVEGKGFSFYTMDEVLKTSGEKKPFFVDKDMWGYYQSIGVLNKGFNKRTYRVITDREGLSYRDYELTSGTGKIDVKPLDQPGKPGPQPLCPGKELSLPMLSKDGSLLAALDVKAGVTKIYEVDPVKGICRETLNLGMFTSKVDFSFDNNRLTFHKFNNEEKGDDYVAVPGNDKVANVYVYDIPSRKLSRITNNTNSNAFYPAFRADGKIVYIEHPKDAPTSSEKSKLVVADPDKARQQPFDFFTPGNEKKLDGLAAIGSLWMQLCSPFGEKASLESAALASLNLDPAQCKRMAEKYWDSFKDDVKKALKRDSVAAFTPRSLSEACPKPEGRLPSGGSAPPPGSDSGERRVPQSCRFCHRNVDWDHLAALRSARTATPGLEGRSFAEEALRRINLPQSDPRHMPRSATGDGAPLDAGAIRDLTAYLQGR